MEIVALFCDGDDFCRQFEPQWQQRLSASKDRQPLREKRLCLSEVMTIVITFVTSAAPPNQRRTFRTARGRGPWPV